MVGDGSAPRQLLREPHLLAHELRTPLAILAGWCSLILDGDIGPNTTPREWAEARSACEDAVARLNVTIRATCGEAEALKRWAGPDHRYITELLNRAGKAVDSSQLVRAKLGRQE